MSSIATYDQSSKFYPPLPAQNGHVIADVSGYEDEGMRQWDQACVEAYERLTSTPHGALAAMEPSRLAKGLDLARSGSVAIEGGVITVTGASGTYTWIDTAQRCPCPDAKRYSMIQCKHMVAARIHQEALREQPEVLALDLDDEAFQEQRDHEPVEVNAAPCPEAMFSATLKGLLGGHEIMLTVRGQSATQFLTNLKAVKDVLDTPQRETPSQTEQAPTPDQHYCAQHGLMKPSQYGDGTYYCPAKLPSGEWCKSRWPEKTTASSRK